MINIWFFISCFLLTQGQSRSLLNLLGKRILHYQTLNYIILPLTPAIFDQISATIRLSRVSFSKILTSFFKIWIKWFSLLLADNEGKEKVTLDQLRNGQKTFFPIKRRQLFPLDLQLKASNLSDYLICVFTVAKDTYELWLISIV